MAAFYRLFSRCKRPAHEEPSQLPGVPEVDDSEEEETARAPAVEPTVVEVKSIARLQPPDLVLPESAPACTSTVRSTTFDGHTTWIASVATSRSSPSSSSTTSRLTGRSPLSPMTISPEPASRPNSRGSRLPMTISSELASRPDSRGSRLQGQRLLLVGRPKLEDSRLTSKRSEETELSRSSTKRSDEPEPEAFPVSEEVTEEITTCGSLSKSPEALPEVSSGEALESQHMMGLETVKEALWVPHISPQFQGMVFYHNVRTNEVSWERQALQDLQVTEWVLHTSAEGRSFYFNEKTLETSWELVPGGVVVPGAKAAAESTAKQVEVSNSAESTAKVASASAGNRLFRPPPLATPESLRQRQETPPRIDQGSPVHTKRMNPGFEKWAMSLCMEMSPSRPELGSHPPAKKGSASSMMPPG